MRFYQAHESVAMLKQSVITEWHFHAFSSQSRAHCERQGLHWMALWPRVGPEILILS